MRQILSNDQPPSDKVYVNDLPKPFPDTSLIVAKKGGVLFLVKHSGTSSTIYLFRLTGISYTPATLTGLMPLAGLEKLLSSGYELYILSSIKELADLV